MAYDNEFRGREPRERDQWRGRSEQDRGQGGRGFFERAGDEVASWFGDDDAGRRREQDERSGGYDREHGDRATGRGDIDRDRQERDTWFGGRSRSPGSNDPGAKMSAGRYDGDRQQRARDEYRPIAGDYGRADGRDRSRGGPERESRGSAVRDQYGDPHYAEWRQRQIDALDRDYDEYRREHQSKFENDFSGWRSQRQSKREIMATLRDGMEVVGSDDQRIGSIDKVKGDRVILRKNDPEAGGVHRSFSCSLIDRIDGERLILAQSSDQAKSQLQREDRGEAYDPRERERGQNEPLRGDPARDDGPHMLERSFSGTYR